jgi:hypothetical protein
MEDFIHTTQTEQEFQTTDTLPTVEQYIHRRIGSGAVKVCYALIEYQHGIAVSPSIIHDEHMRVVWDETDIVTSITNDLLSLKKEIAHGQVDTILPLLYLRHGSIEAAVEAAVEMMRESVRKTDEAVEVLERKYKGHPELENVRKIVHACKVTPPGNYYWTLRSGRFGVHQEDARNGITVTV